MENDLIHRKPWEPGPRHPRMPRAERAKIFMPFAALKGFEEEIASRETRLLPRPALSEEQTEEISRTLREAAALLRCGGRPEVRCRAFREERPGWGQYTEITGRVRQILAEKGRLILEEEEIPLPMLTEITLISEPAQTEAIRD